MYSATFAMTVIIGIALANFFLGFAGALLMGRGPRNWSDVERSIVVRYFSPHLFLLRSGPNSKRLDLRISTASAPVVELDSNSTADNSAVNELPSALTEAEPAPQTKPDRIAPRTPDSLEESEVVSKTVTLQSKAVAQLEDDQPPEKVLDSQLEGWRNGDDPDEVPSVTGLCVTTADADIDDALSESLMNAVKARISSQLRKDRRVICLQPNQFVWFSADMHPDDARMPAERIRQLLGNTRFTHGDTSVDIKVHAAVAAGKASDQAAILIERLQKALQYSRDEAAGQTCLDLGEGPDLAESLDFEIEEAQCELVV